MSDPFDDPTAQWGLIFYGGGLYRRAHSRQEWAQIADAIGTADLLHPNGIRGDDAWCRVAADTYGQLHAAAAYADLRPGEKAHWHTDEHLIRAWLHAPVIPAANDTATTLEAHGWQYTFDPARTPDPADLTIVADVAQQAGVVGAPHHKVSVLRWVQGGLTRNDAFLVLLWPPDGPARGSCAIGIDDLVQPGREPADAIVDLLQAVGQVANTLLEATAAAQDDGKPPAHRVHAVDPAPVHRASVDPVEAPAMPDGQGRRQGNPGRVFPPLSLVHPHAPPMPADLALPPTPTHDTPTHDTPTHGTTPTR